jgi:hypothetical protein
MRVYVGLIMLAAFCHSCLSQVEYNCLLIKVDWLAACIALRVFGVCSGCLKTDPVPYFGLELTINVIKSQIHLVRQYL